MSYSRKLTSSASRTRDSFFGRAEKRREPQCVSRAGFCFHVLMFFSSRSSRKMSSTLIDLLERNLTVINAGHQNWLTPDSEC